MYIYFIKNIELINVYIKIFKDGIDILAASSATSPGTSEAPGHRYIYTHQGLIVDVHYVFLLFANPTLSCFFCYCI